MGSQFLNTVKYGLLAVIAFLGPKFITESGYYLSNVEKGLDSGQGTKTEKKIEPLSIDRSRNTKYMNTKPLPPSQGSTVTVSYPKENLRKTSNSVPSGVSNNQTMTVDPLVQVSLAMKVTPMEDILRFDRSPGWIVGHWNRVDTVSSKTPWLGYRVMVLTGNNNDDLAGVLTWYFDHREMKRIEFSGQTGDIRKILAYLSRRFGMVLNSESTASHYIYESSLLSQGNWDGKKSRINIYPAKTFLANRQKEYFDLDFTLERPE